jgi:DNA-binding response OmpR family regulator
MGATAKNHISQFPRPTTEGNLIPAVFLDPASGVHMVEPGEISRLSHLSPVIVFVPRRAGTQENHSGGTSAGLARVDRESAAQRLQTFFTGSEQIDRPNCESEAVFGEVTVNFPKMLAYRGNKPIPLTNIEFKLLKYLITNARRVIWRDELLNEVWGYESYPCANGG